MSRNTTPDNAYYRTHTWRKKREIKLRMEQHTCQQCGASADRGTELHVHHIRYDNFGGDELMSELEVLCVHCHRDKHRLHKNKRRTNLIGNQARWAY